MEACGSTRPRPRMKGGKGGPAIVPGQGDLSLLIEAVRGDGTIERMPLKRPPFSDAEIELLRGLDRSGSQVSGLASCPGFSTNERTGRSFLPGGRPCPRS